MTEDGATLTLSAAVHQATHPWRLRPNDVVHQRWRVCAKLGEGGCGAVYEVIDLQARGSQGAELRNALKVEQMKKGRRAVLKMEAAVLRRLTNKPHVCSLFASGRGPDFFFIVMTLLGENLSALRYSCHDQHMTLATTVRVGLQALEAVRQVHEVGFVHRDVKPGNFALGHGERAQRTIFILDYGLSRLYMRRDKDGAGVLRRPRSTALFRGTFRYCSPNMHRRLEQGRHDDIWSLLYMLIELLHGLPWNGLRSRTALAQMKHDISDEELLRDCPAEFQAILSHVRSLDYATAPDYALIAAALRRVQARKGYDDDAPFDWEPGGEHFEHTRSDHSKPDRLLQADPEPTP